MHQTMTAVADQYKLNTMLFDKVLDGFQDSEQFTRPNDKGNSVNWVAGHLTSARFSVANMLGVEDQCPWGKLYEGGNGLMEQSKYPSLTEIKSAFKDISAKLEAKLAGASEDVLTKEPPWKAPGMEPSVRGSVAFMSFHESYHLGQLGYLRKFHDLEGAFG